MAAVLLQRGQRAGLGGLIRHYHRLPDDVQSLLVERLDDMDGAMRDAARRHAPPQAAENVIALVRRGRTVRLAYLLAELVRHRDDQVVRKAGQLMLDFALWASGRSETAEFSSWTGVDGRYVEQVVCDAVVRYAGYGRTEVLQAFVVLAGRCMGGAESALSNWRHPAVEPMRQVLVAWRGPETHRSLLRMIHLPPLAGAVHEAMRAAADHGSLGAVVAHSHLCHRGSTAAALRGAHIARWLAPGVEAIRHWPPEQTRNLPRWLDSIGLPAAVLTRRLAAIRRVDDAPSRLAALRQLMARSCASDDTTVDESVETFCDDSDAQIACIALRHLIRRAWPGLFRLLPRLVNSQHPAVRRIAGTKLGAVAFDRFWQAWPGLVGPQRLSAGCALIKIDPHFHRLLGGRLVTGDRPQVLRALSVIHTLNQGSLFEPALLALAADRDAVIVSAAVTAIGSAEGPDARAALNRALDHADSRVRANAVESLERIESAQQVRRWSSMAKDEENRPRANAIGALLSLRHGEAIGALTRMLRDARRRHRISALWLVDSMGLVDVASHVAELSISDPDAGVQQRAIVVVKNLIQTLSDGSSEAGVPDAAPRDIRQTAERTPAKPRSTST